MGVHRYRQVNVTSLTKTIHTVVDPLATLGSFGNNVEIDITLADDTQLSVLDEVMASYGFEYVVSNPPANDSVRSQIPVIDYLGLATAPPVAPVGSMRLYFDTATGTLRYSSSGGAYANAGLPAVETLESPLYTAAPAIGQGTRALPTTFEGGIYRNPTKNLSLVNLTLRSTAAAAGAIVRVACYQKSDGTLGGDLPLLFTADSAAFVVAGAQTFTIAVPPGITLVPGQYVVLIGRAAAPASPTVTMRVWNLPTYELLTSLIPAGRVPYQFTTALLSTVAPPATFNPLISATATATNVCPLMLGGS